MVAIFYRYWNRRNLSMARSRCRKRQMGTLDPIIQISPRLLTCMTAESLHSRVKKRYAISDNDLLLVALLNTTAIPEHPKRQPTLALFRSGTGISMPQRFWSPRPKVRRRSISICTLAMSATR